VLTSDQIIDREKVMRTLEWLMMVLTVPAVVWTLIVRRPWPLWVRIATLCAALLLPFHAFFEAPHWQMAPIYLAILLLLFPLLLLHFPLLGSFDKVARVAALAAVVLIVVGLGLCTTLPMFHLPTTTGSYQVGTQTMYFIDPNREESHPHAPRGNREVVVQIWYPTTATAGPHAAYRLWKECDLRSSYQVVLKTDSLQDAPVAPGHFPVILFNHAWRGFRNRSTNITQELASHGFVVIGISHPYNAAIVQLHDGKVADGRSQIDLGDFYQEPVLTLEQRLDLAKSELAIQTADDKLVLDRLSAANDSATSPFSGHLDITHVGAFGHSFGGSVSAELARDDSRVISAIILDDPLFGPVGATGLDKPLFRIAAVPLEIPPGSENSPILSTRVYAQMTKLGEDNLINSFQHYGGYQVVIRGIDHENFTDKGFFSPFHWLTGIGELPQPRAAAIINSYILAFFEQTLRGQPQSLLSGQKAPFSEVVSFQVWRSNLHLNSLNTAPAGR
jgi:dienelactone hydrolase